NMLCTVNVQHNCHDHKCPAKRTKVVQQEREVSQQKELHIEHISPHSLILNTAQMRNASYLMPFRRR
ncbi:hypothetical protein EV360DRAFT_25958, partial [Lentinula raphanica]